MRVSYFIYSVVRLWVMMIMTALITKRKRFSIRIWKGYFFQGLCQILVLWCEFRTFNHFHRQASHNIGINHFSPTYIFKETRHIHLLSYLPSGYCTFLYICYQHAIVILILFICWSIKRFLICVNSILCSIRTNISLFSAFKCFAMLFTGCIQVVLFSVSTNIILLWVKNFSLEMDTHHLF